MTFICDGSRNDAKFIDLFDGVFLQDVDLDAPNRRLDEQPDFGWGGGKPPGRELIARLQQTKDDIPQLGILIDASAPIAQVVDKIVREAQQIASPVAGG